MALIPFSLEHISCLNVKEDALGTMARPEMASALDWLSATRNGKTLTTPDGKTVLGILGMVPVLPHVCEVFVIASKEQMAHPMTFARAVKREIGHLRLKYRRIQATAANDKFHARWLSWLGFDREGVLKSFGLDGEDMVMWGMVSTENNK